MWLLNVLSLDSETSLAVRNHELAAAAKFLQRSLGQFNLFVTLQARTRKNFTLPNPAQLWAIEDACGWLLAINQTKNFSEIVWDSRDILVFFRGTCTGSALGPFSRFNDFQRRQPIRNFRNFELFRSIEWESNGLWNSEESWNPLKP